MTYECHVTFDNVTPEGVGQLNLIANRYGWKTSFIDGDPVLGPGKRFFLTGHADDANVLMTRMHLVVFDAVVQGYEAVRQKIEHVIFDTNNPEPQ